MATSSKPTVILLCLEKEHGFEDVYAHLLHALNQRASIVEVLTDDEMIHRLAKPQQVAAVVVADAAVASPSRKRTLDALVRYSKNGGGTVVYGCGFPRHVRLGDQNTMFHNVWGIRWLSGQRRTCTSHLSSQRITGLDKTGLASTYLVDALHLSGPGLADSHCVYRSNGAPRSTPVAFTSIGNGYLGYVGDLNASEETSAIIIAMCRLGRPAVTPEERTRPKFMILGILQEHFLDEGYDWMTSSIASKASVVRVEDAAEAKKLLAASAAQRPDAVLVIDGAVVEPRYRKLRAALVTFTKQGGTVVLGANFSNGLPWGEKTAEFFAQWGLTWQSGNYHRTTVHLNPNGIPGMDTQGLDESYSVKALNLKNVHPSLRVYFPSSSSRTESHVYEPIPVDTAQTPAAFVHVGRGYLGYIGDVNGEDPTTKLILRMLGLSLDNLEENTYDRVVGVRIFGGKVEPIRASEQERADGSGSRPPVGRLPWPGAAPSEMPRRSRSREAEVRARAESRRAVLQEKNAAGEKLKEKGNELFRKGDFLGSIEAYMKAAEVDGPRSPYLTNLTAAFLKLEDYWEVDRIATRALVYNKRLIKARYRRGLARKGLGRIRAAIHDFEVCLEQDPQCAEAKQELATARGLLDEEDSDSDDEVVSEDEGPRFFREIGCTSDSEDFKHEGNGKQCKFYNCKGCKKGPRWCPYKHAPDNRSIRDELGRNVCLFYLLNKCPFPDEFCDYAHSKRYLPSNGWWDDPRLVQHFQCLLATSSRRRSDDEEEDADTDDDEETYEGLKALLAMRAEADAMDQLVGRILNGSTRDTLGWTFEDYCDREIRAGHAPGAGPVRRGAGGNVASSDEAVYTEEEVKEFLKSGNVPGDAHIWDLLDFIHGPQGW